ncbi:MAG: hypothetical protein AAFU64_04925, partial [Bacteroidota bacterium]
MYFEEVYKNFTTGQSKNARILKLIEYAKQHLKVEELLGHIKEERAGMYAKHLGTSNDATNSNSSKQENSSGSQSSAGTKQDTPINRLNQLLAQDDLKGALELLDSQAESHQNDKLKNDVIMQSGRLHRIEEDYNKGTLGYEAYQMERTKIRNTINYLRDEHL